jgi:hypothetical protein
MRGVVTGSACMWTYRAKSLISMSIHLNVLKFLGLSLFEAFSITIFWYLRIVEQFMLYSFTFSLKMALKHGYWGEK